MTTKNFDNMNPTLVRDLGRVNSQVLVKSWAGRGALTWVFQANEGKIEARIKAIEYIIAHCHDSNANGTFWLISGNRSWIPSTPRTRYIGLWKSIERNNIKLPDGERYEHPLYRDESIKFNGAISLTDAMNDLSSIETILRLWPGFLLFAEYEVESSITELLNISWNDDEIQPSSEVFTWIERSGHAAVSILSEFADHVVVVVLAPPPTKLNPSTSSQF